MAEVYLKSVGAEARVMFREVSLSERLERLLKLLTNDCPNVEAAALVSTDGLIMASALNGDADEDKVAAMSAALLSVAEKIGRELGRGDFEAAIVRGSEGLAIVTPVDSEALLVVLAGKRSRLGLILYEMKHVSNMLKQELKGVQPL